MLTFLLATAAAVVALDRVRLFRLARTRLAGEIADVEMDLLRVPGGCGVRGKRPNPRRSELGSLAGRPQLFWLLQPSGPWSFSDNHRYLSGLIKLSSYEA
jgi:hypothetical protein